MNQLLTKHRRKLVLLLGVLVCILLLTLRLNGIGHELYGDLITRIP